MPVVIGPDGERAILPGSRALFDEKGQVTDEYMNVLMLLGSKLEGLERWAHEQGYDLEQFNKLVTTQLEFARILVTKK